MLGFAILILLFPLAFVYRQTHRNLNESERLLREAEKFLHDAVAAYSEVAEFRSEYEAKLRRGIVD